jgi:hypothetical protein
VQKAVGLKDGCRARYEISDESGSRVEEMAVFVDLAKNQKAVARQPSLPRQRAR